MSIQNISPIIENLQLRNKTLSCLKVDKNIRYPSKLFPKMNSLMLVDSIEENLLNDISKNKELRDFLCVNIQGIGQELSSKHKKFIQSKNAEGSIFTFRNFGFVNDCSIKSNDEDYYNYLKDLTISFGSSIDFLGNKKILDLNKDKIKGFETNILTPFSHLLKSIGVDKNPLNEECIEIDSTPRKIQDLIFAWQNKTIFERIIAKLIENELKCRVYCSKYIVINQQNPFEFSLEFDNIFVWNNRICFVELKNGLINRNDVFQFLGKVRAVESYYRFKANKIAVIGTRPKEEIFNELEEKMLHFKVFDIDDYHNDLEKFFEFIKS